MVVLQPTAMDWLGTKNKPVHILVPNLLKFRVMVTLFIVYSMLTLPETNSKND